MELGEEAGGSASSQICSSTWPDGLLGSGSVSLAGPDRSSVPVMALEIWSWYHLCEIKRTILKWA